MLSKKVLQDLLDPEGRREFLAARINSRIAYQIRALRNQRGWKQAEFARKLGKPQSNVSTRLENPDYDGHKISTLREVANAFDMALLVTFVDYHEFLSRTSDLAQESLEVESFSPNQLKLFEAELEAVPQAEGPASTAAKDLPSPHSSIPDTRSLPIPKMTAIDSALEPTKPLSESRLAAASARSNSAWKQDQVRT